MKRLFFIFLAGFALLSCNQNLTDKMTGKTECTGINCKAIQKISTEEFLYKTNCNDDSPTTTVLTGVSPNRLSNQSYASIDLFLLKDGSFQLSYLEKNGTLLTSRIYFSATDGHYSWSMTDQPNQLVLRDTNAESDLQIIGNGVISKSSQNKSLEITFAKNLDNPGLSGQKVKLMLTEKPYGLGMKTMKDICK